MILKAIFASIFICGFAMLLYALKLPYYTDVHKKEQLEISVQTATPENYAAAKERYYTEIDTLQTAKTNYLDLGSGLLVFSVMLLTIFYLADIDTWQDLMAIRSCGKASIFILVNVGWLILIPGTYIYYGFRLSRGDYPSFSDSVGIPIAGTIPLMCLGLVPLNLFMLFTSTKSRFPARLFLKWPVYTFKLVLLEVFWGFFILLSAAGLLSVIVDGDHVSIVSATFLMMVLLSLRAGQINGPNTKDEDPALAAGRSILS